MKRRFPPFTQGYPGNADARKKNLFPHCTIAGRIFKEQDFLFPLAIRKIVLYTWGGKKAGSLGCRTFILGRSRDRPAVCRKANGHVKSKGDGEMENNSIKQRNTGLAVFFISGICVISGGVVVSILQEKYGFAYGMTGTLLSLMSIGNLLAGLAAGVLPGKIGMKRTMLILTGGYAIGYGAMAVSGRLPVLAAAFFLVGVAKGGTLNCCTILVGDNSKNRTKGMNMMHSCYALGALLCPFAIAASFRGKDWLPMLVLALCGLLGWLAFVMVPLEEKGGARKEKTDWGFLGNKKFWLLTGLLFCQNAAETSVTGWLVTYFKGSGILSRSLSTYTVTIMWSATLAARLLIAFVLPLKNAYTAMIKMGVFCTAFYVGLMMAKSQTAAVVLLFAFAFAMAGMNPTAVASAGKMTSVTSIGIMLPAASSGAILMPWIIGIIAEKFGIGVGMASNIVPCAGMLLFSVAVWRSYSPDRPAHFPR